jgi:hypothetical protein
MDLIYPAHYKAGRNLFNPNFLGQEVFERENPGAISGEWSPISRY